MQLNASLRKDEYFASEYNYSVCLSVISHSVSWQNFIKAKKNNGFEWEELCWPKLCAVGPWH